MSDVICEVCQRPITDRYMFCNRDGGHLHNACYHADRATGLLRRGMTVVNKAFDPFAGFEFALMTEKEITQQSCAVFSLAKQSINDYTRPADGFCDKCAFHGESFRNTGHILDYVRRAVLNQLIYDKFEIAKGFDPQTGKEINDASEADSNR